MMTMRNRKSPEVHPSLLNRRYVPLSPSSSSLAQGLHKRGLQDSQDCLLRGIFLPPRYSGILRFHV